MRAVFANPTLKTLAWDDIEAMLDNCRLATIEGGGSRAGLECGDLPAGFQRPRPGQKAKPHQVKAARDFLKILRMTP